MLSSLTSNSTVIGPSYHQCVASKKNYWLVTSKLSLATMLVSWKVSVEPCRLYYGWQTESNLGFQSHWIEVYGKEITPSTVAKDLGIYIDESLTYNKHITKTLSTCLHQIIQINRIKHLLDKKTILLLMNSFIFSKLYYYYCCSTVWSNTSKHNINKPVRTEFSRPCSSP